jgi:hypothetical protein
MNIPKIDLKWGAILILGGFFLASIITCNKRNGQITQMQLNKQTTDSMLNAYGQTILTQEVLITTNQQAIKDLTDSIFKLTKAQDRKIKDVIAYYSARSEIKIKDKLVPYIDTIERKQWEDSISAVCSKVIEYYEGNTITVPITAQDTTNKNYRATLTATLKGIVIDSLTIPNKLDVRFVTLKGGLLKKNQQGKLKLWLKKSIQVQVLNSNDLLKVYDQKSILYIPPKKARWLEKTILIGTGIFLGSKL